MCQTTKTLTPENPESPANKGFHEPNNTKMYNSRYRITVPNFTNNLLIRHCNAPTPLL